MCQGNPGRADQVFYCRTHKPHPFTPLAVATVLPERNFYLGGGGLTNTVTIPAHFLMTLRLCRKRYIQHTFVKNHRRAPSEARGADLAPHLHRAPALPSPVGRALKEWIDVSLEQILQFEVVSAEQSPLVTQADGKTQGLTCCP